jgi:uncharacterized protein with FMN-binding domain
VYVKNRHFNVTVTITDTRDVDVTVNEPASLSAMGAEATRELNGNIQAMIVRIETERAIPVDGVSGATYTSLALLKAVEKAVAP